MHLYFRRHRVRCDGGWRVVLHVPAGQLESGVPDDSSPLQTQQPGVRRQTLHHRRPGHVREPGPCGEVRVQPASRPPNSQAPPAAPSWRLHSWIPGFDFHLHFSQISAIKVGRSCANKHSHGRWCCQCSVLQSLQEFFCFKWKQKLRRKEFACGERFSVRVHPLHH